MSIENIRSIDFSEARQQSEISSSIPPLDGKYKKRTRLSWFSKDSTTDTTDHTHKNSHRTSWFKSENRELKSSRAAAPSASSNTPSISSADGMGSDASLSSVMEKKSKKNRISRLFEKPDIKTRDIQRLSHAEGASMGSSEVCDFPIF